MGPLLPIVSSRLQPGGRWPLSILRNVFSFLSLVGLSTTADGLVWHPISWSLYLLCFALLLIVRLTLLRMTLGRQDHPSSFYSWTHCPRFDVDTRRAASLRATLMTCHSFLLSNSSGIDWSEHSTYAQEDVTHVPHHSLPERLREVSTHPCTNQSYVADSNKMQIFQFLYLEWLDLRELNQ